MADGPRTRIWPLPAIAVALAGVGSGGGFGLYAWKDAVEDDSHKVVPWLEHAPEIVFVAALLISILVLFVGIVRGVRSLTRDGLPSAGGLSVAAVLVAIHFFGSLGAGVGLFYATFEIFTDTLVSTAPAPTGGRKGYLYRTGVLCWGFELYTRESWSLVSRLTDEQYGNCQLSGSSDPPREADIVWDRQTESFRIELDP